MLNEHRNSVVLVRATFLSLTLFALIGCGCSNTIKSQTPSADRKLTVYISERNCGATTDYSSIVNVQSASGKFDSDDGQLFVARGQHDISAKWTGAKEILVTCPSCSRQDIFREVSVMGDIDVSYALTSAPSGNVKLDEKATNICRA